MKLDKRMKQYEGVSRNFLTRRVPVIIRIDGRAFHTFTKGMNKPFDPILVQSMQETMKYLCENIQGCVLGYTQSDEITLVLADWQSRDTDAWFDNNIQKMASISASMATLAFNKAFSQILLNTDANTISDYIDTYLKKQNKAMFDSRVFNIPKEEVANCLLWRQLDATRNSIEAVGQAYFSAKQLNKKNCNNIQDMLMLEKGINWNNFPTNLKRGSCCIKTSFTLNKGTEKECVRSKWVIDNEIPIFTKDFLYIENKMPD